MKCYKYYSHQKKKTIIVPFSMNRELMTLAVIAEKITERNAAGT